MMGVETLFRWITHYPLGADGFAYGAAIAAVCARLPLLAGLERLIAAVASRLAKD
jgi:hypothetical protein